MNFLAPFFFSVISVISFFFHFLFLFYLKYILYIWQNLFDQKCSETNIVILLQYKRAIFYLNIFLIPVMQS